MAFEKFRAFMDLGRVQGISTTGAIVLLGAFTSTASPSLATIFWLAVISIFAHSGGAALNELCDRKLDASLQELSRKPMVSGILSVREARTFIAGCAVAASTMTVFLFGIAALSILLLGFLWLAFYSLKGKRIPFIYDLAFPVSYSCMALFGTLAAGRPTSLSLVFAGIVATVSAFSQWENGLKDADNDRRFGIQSLAIRMNVSSGKGIRMRDPFFMYGAGIKAVFLALCLVPMLVMKVPMAYLLLVVMLGVPDQLFTLRMFLGKKTRPDYVSVILLDVPASWLVGSAISILIGGWPLYIGLTLFLVGGYFAGSAIQSGAEFKFRRCASPLRTAPVPNENQGVRRIPAPIMMTWAPAGPSGLRRVKSELVCTRPQVSKPLTGGKTAPRRPEEIYVVTPMD